MQSTHQKPPAEPNHPRRRQGVFGRLKTRHSIVLKLAVFFVALLLTLGVVEIALHLAGRFPPLPRNYVGEYEFKESPNFIADSEVGWRMRPGSAFNWETNTGDRFIFYSDPNGFRCGADGLLKERNDKNIVIVGDSMMWGYSVTFPETCGSLLEEALKECSVYNLAMPGYGLDQVWLCLREWGFPLNPDLVIVGLYTDDFERCFIACREEEVITKPLLKLEDGGLEEQTEEDQPIWLIKALQRHSRVFGLYTRTNRKLGFHYGIGSWWSLNEAIIDAMRNDCREAGIPLLFIHIPYPDGRAFPALNSYMNEIQANYIDLVELWGGARKDLYIEGDIHLNSKGHQFMADALLERIETILD